MQSATSHTRIDNASSSSSLESAEHFTESYESVAASAELHEGSGDDPPGPTAGSKVRSFYKLYVCTLLNSASL